MGLVLSTHQLPQALRAERRSVYLARLPQIEQGEIEHVVPAEEEIPPPPGDFPPLPPDPYEDAGDRLPPLEEELYRHGGSHLYAPEGDRLNWPGECSDAHYDLLRLPEDWQKPRPLEGCAEFLGADPIYTYPHLHWPGCGYDWEPRLVGYGSYQLFAFAFEEDDRRRDAIGHRLLVDVDLRLTGTERLHVQWRPVGRENTGGSYYRFNDPAGYVDNSTAAPDRYWLEGEVHSIFGAYLDPFAVADVHFVAGRFPFALHNSLLINTDLLGVAINKNTLFVGDLSNVNVQLFAAREDVAAFPDAVAGVYGTHASADYRHSFFELTYAFVQNTRDSRRNEHFAALSGTHLWGPWTFALRKLFKWGDEGGRGAGQLLVFESNHTRYFEQKPLGLEYGVFYGNAFVATAGWNPISGGNFNRLQTAFEVDPLTVISAGVPLSDNWGLALGVQLFRHHEDESIIPEIAFQSPQEEPVFGLGLRYLRKTSASSFLEVLGVWNVSDDPRFDRRGIFVAQTLVF